MARLHAARLRAARPLAILAIAIVAMAGVTEAAAGAGSEDAGILRTADGRPDLSGYYNVATLTPLQRPKEFGDKLFLSPDEAAALVDEERKRVEERAQRSDPGRSAPPEGGAPPVGDAVSVAEINSAGNVGGYNNFWIDRGTDVVNIDGKFRTSIITDPPHGRRPRMTPEARAREDERSSELRPNDGTAWWIDQPGPGPYDDPESRPEAERCLFGMGSTAGPPMLPVLYNNLKRIVQTRDHVAILVEMVHDTRIVRIAGEHAPPEVRRRLGDSVGRWEGDTP